MFEYVQELNYISFFHFNFSEEDAPYSRLLIDLTVAEAAPSGFKRAEKKQSENVANPSDETFPISRNHQDWSSLNHSDLGRRGPVQENGIGRQKGRRSDEEFR